MQKTIKKRKLFIVEGVDRIGKSSVAIPELRQSLFWRDFDYTVLNNPNNLNEIKQLLSTIEVPECLKKCAHSISDLSTLNLQYPLYSFETDALIIDRLHLSILAYSTLFDRFAENNFNENIVSMTKQELVDTMKYFDKSINKLFDVHVLIFTWADNESCIKDEKLTICQSQDLNQIFKDVYFKYFAHKLNYHLFVLEKTDDGNSNIKEVITKFIEDKDDELFKLTFNEIEEE